VQKHKLGVEKFHEWKGSYKNMGNKKEKKNTLCLQVQIKQMHVSWKIIHFWIFYMHYIKITAKSFFQQRLFSYNLGYFEKNIFD